MPEPCKFSSLDSCQKRFLWTHKEVDLALHPVVGLVLQGRDAEKFPQALGFESLGSFLRVSQQGPCFPTITKKKAQGLNLKCRSDQESGDHTSLPPRITK